MTRFGIVALLVLAAPGCSDTASNAGCERDSDCPEGRYCISGQCEAPNDGSGRGPVPDADPTDTATADTRRADAGTEDPGSTDTGGRDGTPISDAGVTEDAAVTDAGSAPSTDVSYEDGRTLSCREMATCGRYLCDRYDYQCKQQFSARTPDPEKSTRQQFDSCIQDNCTGKTGQEWVGCLAEECSGTWEACYRRPDEDPPLLCSGFQACVQQCSVADDPRACRLDCQERAADSAPEHLQAFHNCLRTECPDTTGPERLDCVRRHCRSELTDCYGC